MSDISMDLLKYGGMGYSCAQILALLALDLQDRDAPELVRAMAGLGHGLGHSGETCGALLGGCAVLGLYAGKGADHEQSNPRLPLMVAELVGWFRESCCAGCGGVGCRDILGDESPDLQRCGCLVGDVFTHCLAILDAEGIDPTVPPGEED